MHLSTRRAVFSGAFFAVHIGNRPDFVTERLVVCVEQIQFSDGRFVRAEQIENDDLVCAGFQPRTGDVHCLLRFDVLIATEVVAVDPRVAFDPMAHVEKSVAG